MNEDFRPIGYLPLSDYDLGLVASNLAVPDEIEKGAPPSAIVTLIDLDAYDPNIDAVVTHRFSERGMIYPDDTFYETRLKSRVTISQSAIDSIGLGGRVAASLSQMVLYNEDNALDAMERLGLALGRAATVRTMPAPVPSASDCGGGALSGAAIVFTGITASMTPSRDGMILVLSDTSERLNTPLQTDLYGGTGGLDGTADLAGAPKPVAFGWTFNSTPVYIGVIDLGDGAKLTYQSNWRRIRGHLAVREKGVAMTEVSASPDIGQWRDWPEIGCFQLGFTPNWIVTCDLRGDAPSGAYAGTTADIVARLLTSLGPQFDASELDAASFAEVNQRIPGEIGWRQGAFPIAAVAALEQILAHCGVWLAGGRDGKFRLAVIDDRH